MAFSFFKNGRNDSTKLTETESARAKKPKPSVRLRTQSFINIDTVENGVICTKDKRYFKILEVMPTNFFNKDALQQAKLVYQFAEYLKVAPKKMQLKIMNVPLDVSDYMRTLHSYSALPSANAQTIKMVDELSNMIINTVETRHLSGNRFFIVFEFEDFELAPDITYVRKMLDMQEAIAADFFERFDCRIVDLHFGDGLYNNYTLYEYILLHFDRTSPTFEEHAERVFNEITEKNWRKKDSITLEDYLSPREISFYNKAFCEINGKFISYHYVKDFRQHVYAGWLNPLIGSQYDVDIDIHFIKEERSATKKKVRGAITRQEVVLENISTNTSLAQESVQLMRSAVALRERMYASDESMYQMSIIVTISADTIESLNDKIKDVYTLMESKDMALVPLHYREEAAFKSTLPFNQIDNELQKITYRNIMSGDVASIFPWNDPAIFENDGIFIGRNKAGRLCSFNNFDTTKYEAPHMMIMGSTGMGKTYATQLLLSRYRMKGAKCFTITPVKGYEYKKQCKNLNGNFISFSADGTNHVNIFDISIPPDGIKTDTATGEPIIRSALGQKLGAVTTYFNIILPFLTPLQESLLNVAVVKAYYAKGITHDNNSLKNADGSYKEVPIISDVAVALKRMLIEDNSEKISEEITLFDTMPDPKEYKKEINDLLAILQPFISGTYKFLNNHTNIKHLDNDYNVFDVSELDSFGQRIVGGVMYTIIEKIKNIMVDLVDFLSQFKVVAIDEAWKLIGEGSAYSQNFIKEMYKVFRAYNACVITASQDIEDWKSKENETVLNTIINNSTFQILLGLKPHSLQIVSDILFLNNEVKSQIEMFGRGDAMLLCSNNSFQLRFDATSTEHLAITTDPQEVKRLLEMEQQKAHEIALFDNDNDVQGSNENEFNYETLSDAKGE